MHMVNLQCTTIGKSAATACVAQQSEHRVSLVTTAYRCIVIDMVIYATAVGAKSFVPAGDKRIATTSSCAYWHTILHRTRECLAAGSTQPPEKNCYYRHYMPALVVKPCRKIWVERLDAVERVDAQLQLPIVTVVPDRAAQSQPSNRVAHAA